MKIGLISDTHNHLPETRRALNLLLEQGAQHLVHCGDVGEDVVDLLSAVFVEHGIRSHVANGNCDRMHGNEARFAPQPAGVERSDSPEFVLAGKRCIAIHGDNAWWLEKATTSGAFDYVFTGHTHRPMDKKIGLTRLLNPGSPVRPRGGPPTALVLDLATGQVTRIPL